MKTSSPNGILEIAERWPVNGESSSSIRAVGFKRLLTGIALTGTAIGCFCLRVSLGFPFMERVSQSLIVPLIVPGLALIPWGIAEILTGRKWQNISPFARMLFLVVGIPGFFAACVTFLTVVQKMANP